jgi:hypothetical protein
VFTASDVVDSTAASDPSMPLTCGMTVSWAISEAMIEVGNEENVEPESRTRDTGATELKDARRAVGESHARGWSRKEKKRLLKRACRWVDEENTSSRVFRKPKDGV